MSSNKRLSFANFPIPFDHPYILPTLFASVTISCVAYYSLQASYHKEMVEALRKQSIRKRRHLHRPEDRYASLQIESLFENPFESWHLPSLKDYVFYWLTYPWQRATTRVPITQEIEAVFPSYKPDFDRMFSTIPSSSSLTESWVEVKKQSHASSPPKTSITWLGQSTCLVTLDGLNILTDPVFSTPSMFKQRIRSSPCELAEFQSNVHIVLLSHDHADHLDEQVVHQLGNSVTWYVPLGLRDYFVNRGVENVIELDWWQEMRHKERPEIIIASVPSMHSSGRYSLNKNQTLWSNFVVKSKDESFFFCGSSGYDKNLFTAIGKVYAPLTLAALPIGGYSPRSIKKSLHMNPSEALKAHHHLGCPRLSIGIHWGTFISPTDEHCMEPQTLLQQTLRKHPLPSSPPSATSSLESQLPADTLTSSLVSSSEGRKKDRNSDTHFTTVPLGKTVFIDDSNSLGHSDF